jgi:hypothetical protein
LGAGAVAENQHGADNDMDAQSQRRISALVEVASTAQSLERHDMPSRQYKSEEIQSHPSSIETSKSGRGRDQDNGGGGKEEENVNAEATRLGVNGGALLEHQTRAMHNYLLQIMAQVTCLPPSTLSTHSPPLSPPCEFLCVCACACACVRLKTPDGGWGISVLWSAIHGLLCIVLLGMAMPVGVS